MLLGLLGEAGGGRVLDAHVVAAPEDLEESLVAPVVVPGVGHQPVGGAVLHAPAQHPDGVAAQDGAAHMLVHAALVAQEVGVHGHGDLHGAVGHDLGLQPGHVVLDVVGFLAEGLVAAVVLGRVLGDAGALALGGGLLVAGPASAVDVVLAGGDGVGLAALVGAVQAAGDDAGLVPEAPGGAGEAAVAAEAARVTAGQL